MQLSDRSQTGPIDLAVHPEVARPGLRLDPPTRTLHGPARAVVLEPRVMQVLLVLAGADGNVVSRDALLAACWGASIVGDDALNRAVAGVRRGLQQAGADGWAVETIARVGYRLLGPPQTAPGERGRDEPAGAQRAGPEPAGAQSAGVESWPEPAGDQAPAPRAGARGDLASATGRPGTPPPEPSPATAARPAIALASVASRRLWMAGGAATAALLGLGLWQRQRRDASRAELVATLEQARQALRQASDEGHRNAVGVLEQALARDASLAPAWGLLALARRSAAEGAPPDRLQAALASVDEAAGRALAIDPRHCDALTARALLLPTFGRWGEVDAALRQVLEIEPGHLPALDALGFLLAGTGVIAAHYPMRLKTVADDPLHAGYNFRSIYSHWMNGQLAAADAAAERGIELWPQHLPTWIARTDMLAYTGRAERALALLDSAPPALPPPLKERARLTWTALAGGSAADRSAARAAALVRLERLGPLTAVGATMDLAALGDPDLALDVAEAFLLERGAVRAGTAWRPGQPWHLDVRRRFTNHLFLPVTAPLRAPRFAALMRDTGLAAHWQRSGRAPDHLLRTSG